MSGSFLNQLDNLTKGGYPHSLLVEVAESLIKALKHSDKYASKNPKGRPVILPYIHKVTHRLKKVPQRHGVPVVFSAPSKLGRLCARVDRGKQRGHACTKKHRKQFV
ncbi:unnamed protein product [Ixodes hexagonus]